MNARKAGWSRRYQTALGKHVAQGTGSSLRLVQTLGREAVALGLETLDLAKAHEQALVAVMLERNSPRIRKRAIERARAFFAGAAVRIEETHRAARKADALIEQLNRKLRRRTKESSASDRRLKHTCLQRKKAESALKKSGVRHVKLLAESRRLLEHLRHLTYACLSAQEDDRARVSRQFRDEIAQGLLGVHVRLLTLKKTAKVATGDLRKEIAGTQRHMIKLTRNMDGVVREYHECNGVHEK